MNARTKAKAEDAEAPVEAKIDPLALTGGMLKVETTGNFMLFDIVTGSYIEASGETEVPDSIFIRECLESGKLKLAD